MRKLTIMGLAMLALFAQAQQTTVISQFNLSGPYRVSTPFAMDTVDVNGKKFDTAALLNTLSLNAAPTATLQSPVLPSLSDAQSVGLLTFYINNADYLKGSITVKAPKPYKLYIDGREAGAELKLAPEHHTVAIKYLAEPGSADSISVTIDANKPVDYTLSTAHPYMVHDMTDGHRVRSMSLSADGAYVAVSFQDTDRDGKSRWTYELRQAKTGQLVRTLAKPVTWMPRSQAYLEEETANGRRMLYRVAPLTGERSLLASDLPAGRFTVSPAEDYLIISTEEEGPKEDRDVFEVLEMDDRQPGWRNRNYLSKLDLKTGICQRITFGAKGAMLSDISHDGQKLLIATSYSRLAMRPTEVADFYLMDAQTLQMDTILQCQGFVGNALFSPDGRQLLFTGTPEAFDRIGCQLPANVTPNMTENELFLFDLASHEVTPLTRDFDPSVARVVWSVADGLIYFTAEDRDYVNMFQLNPKTGAVSKLPVHGDNVFRYDMARQAPVLAYLSYKTLEPASAYVATVSAAGGKKGATGIAGKQLQLFDGRTVLGDAEVGTCQDWNFQNSRGDTVYGRLYLPKDFDAQKKYPMIVYYYGGCSPVSRNADATYSPQYWNSLGYVAYILQPSGATGFGQEWASRHVNTAGRGPAEDIIEGTKKICEEHPFIDAKHIGCMGASYGGFMTQYLQTQTDIFAAAVSHAGIANHTSYWGEGYWGYNYSEVSMANSYPWSHRQLYVDQSPLFNADKIHTPLLLLHGNADTNVPLVESLQMFTALKLLGRDVALVEVEGENHHILDYHKREKWLATQMAWFQRWLKGDSTWWDALYPKKNL